MDDAVSGFRWEIEAFAGPDREALVGGRRQLLVRVRLFDPPGVCDEHGQSIAAPPVFTDLRPVDARRLAAELQAAATDAEAQTHAAGYWESCR